jgi:hypothetical protein
MAVLTVAVFDDVKAVSDRVTTAGSSIFDIVTKKHFDKWPSPLCGRHHRFGIIFMAYNLKAKMIFVS